MNRHTICCILGTSLLSYLVGCASAHLPQVTVLPEADGAASSLVAFLDSQNVPTIKPGNGSAQIAASQQCRDALIRFMKIARLKLDTCAVNIANQNTSRDADGKPNPYRRRIVVLTNEGEAQTGFDESPFQRRFQPGHPDAGTDGLVKYPNVDLAIEFVDAQVAAAEYEMAATILRRLDPSIVITQSPDKSATAQLDRNFAALSSSP